MRLLLATVFIFVLSLNLFSQDTVYARKVIRFLTSKKCFGRGYIHNGLQTAEKFLTSEFKSADLVPLFDESYMQSFYHNVNTFPKKCEVKINGKKLRPGIDFIPDPACASVKGKFNLQRADSVTFINITGPTRVAVAFKKKLTFSVSKTALDFCSIEIDQNKFKEDAHDIELNIENKLVSDFKSKNIGGFINGGLKSDTMIVFTAHYDHLGGIDNACYFPGANDNASGVSMILNLVKYYKANPPKYKTVFIFFAGEEAGLLGSKYFVENKTMDLKKIKFLINLDLLGTGDDGIMVVNGAVLEKEFSMLSKINVEKNLVKEIKKRGKAANSDHYWFTEAGVPCFFIYTLGGTTSYHDVYDTENQLPLTDYVDVFKLITTFAAQL